MPTYEYRCKQCGHVSEEFQQITEEPLLRCPNCNTDNLARVMGTGVGLIFKGSGFYLTDYKKGGGEKEGSEKKKEGKKEGKKEEKKPEKKESKPDSTGESSKDSSSKS